MMSRHYVLAAGGTGGHMIPAHALADELLARGHRVALITDDRGARIPGLFDNAQVHILPAGRLAGGPVGWLKAVKAIHTGRAMALRLYETFLPSAVIGFGGYPTLPPIMAARSLGIPTAIHEQNAVMGRANRFLSRFADRVALSFSPTKRMHRSAEPRSLVTGTPVRDTVLSYREVPYVVPEPAGRFLLLVFGGSQGAHFFAEILPRTLPLLSSPFRWRLTLVQQAREEDLAALRATYKDAGIAAHLAAATSAM